MATSELGACEWFVWDLRRSNLIDRGQLDQVIGEFLKRNPRAEPQQLADYLVSQDVLSAFQADRILQGKIQGLVLGPYVLLDGIGSGSMGQVYKAINKTDNQLYAVKVLPRRSMWNVRLARRQVRAFGQFTHPAVVPFVDVGTSGGLHYLVWPLVSGEALDGLVQRQGTLTAEQTIQVATQIAQGLAVCHQNGLFHGLIKPSNVMIGADGQARILDFGIGSLLVENEGESLVDTMSAANTLTSGLDCAAPESIMEPTNRTVAGDQYSLGCTVYYCLAGKFPFPEGNAVEKMMAHQSMEPDPITKYVPDLPPALVAVLDRLIQKDPENRFPSVDDVAEALGSAAGGAAARSQPGRPRPQPTPASMPVARPTPAPAAPGALGGATPTAVSPTRAPLTAPPQQPARPAAPQPPARPVAPPLAPLPTYGEPAAAPRPAPRPAPPQQPARPAPQQPAPPAYGQPLPAPPNPFGQPQPAAPNPFGQTPPQPAPALPSWASGGGPAEAQGNVPGGWVEPEREPSKFAGVAIVALAVVLVVGVFAGAFFLFKPAPVPKTPAAKTAK